MLRHIHPLLAIGTLPLLPPFDVLALVAQLRQRYGHERPRIAVSFSGGRTSALMAALLKVELGPYCDLLFTFANTSRENDDTLRFVRDVDRHFGLGVVWLEAEVHYDQRKASTSRVVTFETACRNGNVFEGYVRKYGLPNNTFKSCTRELKTNPMEHYVRQVHGWSKGTYLTALGIRADERRRVRDTAVAQDIAYPLAHWWPMDKQDVLTFWEGVAWDLNIPERLGNCVDCHKKSDKKLAMLAREDISIFEFPIRLDRLYSNVGPNNVPGPRKRYRGYMSTLEKLASFDGVEISTLADDSASGSCTESCELYDMEGAGA